MRSKQTISLRGKSLEQLAEEMESMYRMLRADISASSGTSGLPEETDPVFVHHAAYGITGAKISNWDTAYGWGNHAGLYCLLYDTTRYFGNSTADGSWRITVNGTGLDFERRESGNWIKKGGVTA